jgi:sortase A
MRTNPRNVAVALALVVGTCVAGTAAHATAGSHRTSAPPSSAPASAVAEPLQDCQTAGTLPAEPTTTTASSVSTTSDAAATTTTTTLVPLPIPVPPPLDNDPEPQQYFGRLQIPAIDVDSPFLEGIRLSTLDYGPGHWPCTAMPGELGNVVVAGHRTSHNADFRRLDELKPGDEVIFDMDNSDGIPTATVADPDGVGGVYVYHVSSVEIVPPDAIWIVNQGYRHEATLFACHPPGSVSERIVAHLDLFSVNGEPAPEPPDPPRTTTTLAPETTTAA